MNTTIIIPEGFTGFVEFPDGRQEEWKNGHILERPPWAGEPVCSFGHGPLDDHGICAVCAWKKMELNASADEFKYVSNLS